MNYEKDLNIDIYKLEDEWIKQPTVYMQYMENVIEAMKIKRDKENTLDILYAKLDDKIRTQARINEEKITEKVVESRITLDEEYQSALAYYRTACYEYDLLHAAEKAIAQKKDALEDLVKLYLAGYFSDPKINRSNIMNDKLNK